MARPFGHYLLVELKRKRNPLLEESPREEALIIFARLILENLKRTGRPVMIRVEGMDGRDG